MRLLHTGNLLFEEFPRNPPLYAILSHTWAKEEVLYQDILSGTASLKPAGNKITKCCERARRDGFDYVWIDTCCIDKNNGAELSQAINSMYEWYSKAALCYVYLEDVGFQGPMLNSAASPGSVLGPQEYIPPLMFSPDSSEGFSSSRWFERGWTLQELLAPRFVSFVNHFWVEIGTRSSLSDAISARTGIAVSHLETHASCNVATKMAWAAGRKTSIPEDVAYSLLGLFGVHLPLIYGEGEMSAFLRLQQELIKQNDDESILAWHGYGQGGRLFAPSPAVFGDSGNIELVDFDLQRQETFLSNKGLIMNPLLYRKRNGSIKHSNVFYIPLNCGTREPMSCVTLCVESEGFCYRRIWSNEQTVSHPRDLQWQKEFEFVGRKRICVRNENRPGGWIPFDDSRYLIIFGSIGLFQLLKSEAVSGIKSLKPSNISNLHLISPSGAIRSPEPALCLMDPGHFALAEFRSDNLGENELLGIAVRRCTGTVTLEAWLFYSREEHLAQIESFKDKLPPSTERRDFIQLRTAHGEVIQIRLRARVFPLSWGGHVVRLKDLDSGPAPPKTYTLEITGPSLAS